MHRLLRAVRNLLATHPPEHYAGKDRTMYRRLTELQAAASIFAERSPGAIDNMAQRLDGLAERTSPWVSRDLRGAARTLRSQQLDTQLIDLMERDGWIITDPDADRVDLHEQGTPLREAIAEHCYRWGVKVNG